MSHDSTRKGGRLRTPGAVGINVDIEVSGQCQTHATTMLGWWPFQTAFARDTAIARGEQKRHHQSIRLPVQGF